MTKRNKMSKIDNVIDALRNQTDLKSEIEKYFHFDSQLWRAIQKHIGDAKECVLIEREPHPVECYRGSGKAVHLQRAYVFGKQYPTNDPADAYEPEIFAMDIEVEYCDDDENRTYTRTYQLRPPKTLELDFTEEKFEAWLEEQRKLMVKRTQDEAAEKLKPLIAQHPALAARILKETRKQQTAAKAAKKAESKLAKVGKPMKGNIK